MLANQPETVMACVIYDVNLTYCIQVANSNDRHGSFLFGSAAAAGGFIG